MEIVYQIFTWLILAAAILLLMPVVCIVVGLLAPGPVLAPIVLLVIYFFLLIIGSLAKVLHDPPSEPQRHSRVQSLMIWLAVIILAIDLMNGLFRRWPVYLFGLNLLYPAVCLFLLTLIAVPCIMFRPFKRHKLGLLFGIAGIVAGFLLWGLGTLFDDGDYRYRGERLPIGYPMPVTMRERFFPEGARDFKIEGESGFLYCHVKWSCTVSEKDFELFRRQNGYRVVLNRSDVNEDPAVDLSSEAGSGDWKKPYYFYRNIHPNGGGLTLRYSVPERKLYGRWANR